MDDLKSEAVNVAAILDRAAIEPGTPENLRVLTAPDWECLIERLRNETAIGFVALFIDGGRVYLLLQCGEAIVPVVSALNEGTYYAVSRVRPEAAWYERLAHDLSGAVAEQANDERPAIALGSAGEDPAWPGFRDTPGDGEYQIGLGPVGGLIAAPYHRHLTLDGNVVVATEHRFGYTHRGVLRLIAGQSPRAAARTCARIDSEACVAHAVAYARAVEAASACSLPLHIEEIRGKMLALEHCTVSLLRLARAAAAVGADRLATRLITLRCTIADTLEAIFGHRLMMDVVVPGGMAVRPDLSAWSVLGDVLQDIDTVTRPFGGWSIRKRFGSNASFAGDWARRARKGAKEACIAPWRHDAEPTVVPIPDHDGFGMGAAASAHGLIRYVLSLELGVIAFGFIVTPGASVAEALERASRFMRIDDFLLRSMLVMPSASGIDL